MGELLMQQACRRTRRRSRRRRPAPRDQKASSQRLPHDQGRDAPPQVTAQQVRASVSRLGIVNSLIFMSHVVFIIPAGIPQGCARGPSDFRCPDEISLPTGGKVTKIFLSLSKLTPYNNLWQAINIVSSWRAASAPGSGPRAASRKPKQFLDILGTGKSFIRHTYERFAKIVPAGELPRGDQRQIQAARAGAHPRDSTSGRCSANPSGAIPPPASPMPPTRS